MRGIFTMRCVGCLRWYAVASVLRCSHLNRALVANEKNGAKTKCLGLRSSAFGSAFVFQLLVV